jgi:hypothetical protein
MSERLLESIITLAHNRAQTSERIPLETVLRRICIRGKAAAGRDTGRKP